MWLAILRSQFVLVFKIKIQNNNLIHFCETHNTTHITIMAEMVTF